MALKSRKGLLLLCFSLFLSFFSLQANAENKTEQLNPANIILEHIKDAHEFHFFSIGDFDASIPLPIILYSPTKGFDFFSSSQFGKEGSETHEGYGLNENNQIYATDNSKVYDFSITKNVVQMILALVVLFLIMYSSAKKYKTGQGVTSAPKGLQNAVEPIIAFVKNDVAAPNLGSKTNKYLPYLLTLFFFILINNLFGLLPAAANVTGNTAFTIVLGVISLVVILASTNGHFWLHIFWPPGVPFLVKIILVPIELAGVLIIKPAALIIRLFANMIAGHIIIASFIVLIFIFGAMKALAGYGFSPLSIIFAVFMYCIEILVAFIQAYIFTMLTAVFIGQSLASDDAHGHGEDAVVL